MMLDYATYMGGLGDDICYGVSVDAAGNVFITGATDSGNFPTRNALQKIFNGGNFDMFISKLSVTGLTLLYSTFLGGSNWDQATSIATDTDGTAFITGITDSTDFPTNQAVQPIYGGGVFDAVVIKIPDPGTTIAFSTYFGGNGWDEAADIDAGPDGSPFIAGFTTSPDFPTLDALIGSYAGGAYDAFVTKLSATGMSVDYSTYLNGTDYDYATGITVDIDGNACITGGTWSADFFTANAFQKNYAGSGGLLGDAFISKLQFIPSSPTPTPTTTPVPVNNTTSLLCILSFFIIAIALHSLRFRKILP
jgi:hypothetical protein